MCTLLSSKPTSNLGSVAQRTSRHTVWHYALAACTTLGLALQSSCKRGAQRPAKRNGDRGPHTRMRQRESSVRRAGVPRCLCSAAMCCQDPACAAARPSLYYTHNGLMVMPKCEPARRERSMFYRLYRMYTHVSHQHHAKQVHPTIFHIGFRHFAPHIPISVRHSRFRDSVRVPVPDRGWRNGTR